MNTIINVNRMLLWGRKFWYENQKPFLLFLLALSGLLFIWQSLFLAFGNPALFSTRVQVSQYIVILYFAGCLSANHLCSDLRDKSKSIAFLMNPVSSVEKTLVTIFFGVIVFFIGFQLAYYAVNIPMVYIANQQHATQHEVIKIWRINEYENPFVYGAKNLSLFYLYFAIQSFFILGAVYFKKYSLLKTSIALFGVWVIYILAETVLTSVLPMGAFFASTATYHVLDFEGIKIIHLPSWLALSGDVFFKFLMAPLLWMATYFRLREKQVV